MGQCHGVSSWAGFAGCVVLALDSPFLSPLLLELEARKAGSQFLAGGEGTLSSSCSLLGGGWGNSCQPLLRSCSNGCCIIPVILCLLYNWEENAHVLL